MRATLGAAGLRKARHSRSSIGERLVLSVETIKSYANKMHAKVDVHSKQELVELVDKKMSEFEVASDTLPRTIL